MAEKPKIARSEVEKAQALARHHAGKTARAQGFDRSALLALAQYGKATVIGTGEEALELLPQTLQVQLCLIEHAKIFQANTQATIADGLNVLTQMALIYHDPDKAFSILTTSNASLEEIRRDFRQEAFRLSGYFKTPEDIEKLSAHITVQMGLTDEAAGKKSPAPPRARRR